MIDGDIGAYSNETNIPEIFGFGGGVRLTTQNPYPFLGVILGQK